MDELDDKIHRLELQITQHVAACAQKNQSHDRWTNDVETRLNKHSDRISALEKRVLVLATLAAGAGGIAGNLLSILFKGW